MSPPIQFIMIGGFLGAGKTTLIGRLAKRFQAAGKHVCVVTNDQADGLVDTELLKSQGLEVNEVAGSCFCCNFDGLTDAMQEFESRQRPDIILAEPVGSCTDLVATIAMPMMERLGQQFVHSPYAVILKPSHGKKILSGKAGGFSEKAEYIFRKQLEEAEIIVINRIDQLSASEQADLKAKLNEQYPGRQIIGLSAKTGENLEALETAFQNIAAPRTSTMDVDYDVYADGEAELGWLNATAELHGTSEMLMNDVAMGLVEALRQSLLKAEAEPGHLKVLCRDLNATSSQSEPNTDVSVANLIDSESETVLSVSSLTKSTSVKAIINARVRLAPEPLNVLVRNAIDAVASTHDASTSVDQMESFRPGRPVPTHRMVLSGDS